MTRSLLFSKTCLQSCERNTRWVHELCFRGMCMHLCLYDLLVGRQFVWPAHGGRQCGTKPCLTPPFSLVRVRVDVRSYVRRLGKDLWPSVDWDRWIKRMRGTGWQQIESGQKDKEDQRRNYLSANNILNHTLIWFLCDDSHVKNLSWWNIIFLITALQIY